MALISTSGQNAREYILKCLGHVLRRDEVEAVRLAKKIYVKGKTETEKEMVRFNGE